MKRKNRLALLVASVLIPIAFFSYSYIVRRSDYEEKLKLYNEGLKLIRSKENPFYPQAKVAFYDSVEAGHAAQGRGVELTKFYKSEALVASGREKEAIDLLEGLKAGPIGPKDPLYPSIQKLLGIAYLRLGERNNCVSGHTAESCIYPIQGSGVYTDPYATQKAIKIYEEILHDKPDNLEARWLLNIAFMTLGRYPAGVPGELLIPGLDQDTSGIKVNPFKEIAGDLGLNSERSEAGGSIVEDFDNDGNLDIVTSSWDLGQSMHYYHNNGDGTFTDQSKVSGLAAVKGGLNLLQADFNNDGLMDILVLRGAWMRELGMQPKTLLRNNGDGTFTDVTVQSGILSFGPTQAATWADFNNDGWLDLFIGQESVAGKRLHPSELYINNHDGTFTNVAAEAGCQAAFFMKGATSGDYNRDGWPDIFISGYDGQKMLLRNKAIPGKIPQFENVTHAAGLDKYPTFTFPTWFFDYDNDGWPDIFVCGYAYTGGMAATAAMESLKMPMPPDESKMYLYHNNHDGTFTDVTTEMGLDHPVFAMGANFGDIDNDGWPDMYLGTGNPDLASLVPNRMFKNMGGHGFREITVAARVGNLQKGHGVSFADIDNDGDQDIFTRIGGAFEADGYFNSLYLNPGQDSANNWISVLLRGTKANRSAIGAHIQVRFTENGVKRTVHMDVNSGGSFGCNPMRKEIGIGRAQKIDELVIDWPGSGTQQVFNNISPRQFLTIEEGNNQLGKNNIKPIVFKSSGMPMKMVDCAPAAVK